MKKTVIILITFFSLTALQGQTWNAVGNGVNGSIESFAVYNGELYVGGQFNNPGGVSPIGLLKWNGVTFDTLPGTYLFGGYMIEAMAVYNNELYVGGHFTTHYSTNPAIFDYIAKWNGTTWSSVGVGFDNVVYSLAVYNGNLYAGGDIQLTGSTYIRGIAKWDGNQWSPVGNGIGTPMSRTMELVEYNNELYAAGNFYISSINSSCIARWNDTIWNAVGNGGINGVVYSLATYNNNLYAGGPYFTIAGGVSVNEIAKWNGTTWAAVGNGIAYYNNYLGDLSALKEYNNELYAGGEFSMMDGDSIKSIARYNGSIWNTVGTGVDSTNIITDTIIDYPSFDTTFVYAPHNISAFQEFNNDLYVGGSFNMIGGITAHNIAKWSTPLSVNEISITNKTYIYPNPFSTQTTIKTDKVFKDATLIVYNSFGQRVKQFNNISGQTINLHRDNLSSGFYFLQLTQDNEILTTDKIVITDK